MISHPLTLGLSTDDTDRLLIMLGRPIMSFNMKKDIEDANIFRKNWVTIPQCYLQNSNRLLMFNN